MELVIEHRPAYALGIVRLEQGDSVQAEAGAMVSMSETIAVDSDVAGGILAGFKRALLGGESFFLNTFTAEEAAHRHFLETSPRWAVGRPHWSAARALSRSSLAPGASTCRPGAQIASSPG